MGAYYVLLLLVMAASCALTVAAAVAAVAVDSPASSATEASYSFFSWDYLTVGVNTADRAGSSSSSSSSGDVVSRPEEPQHHRQEQEQSRLVQTNLEGLFGYLQEMESAREGATTNRDSQLGEAKQQLRTFVEKIASLYHPENPYHNFEHASHVSSTLQSLLTTMGTQLDRIEKKPTERSTRAPNHERKLQILHTIHHDAPLKFALLLAALVHDVDHQGVTNAQLRQEEHPLAHHYSNSSSIAEHHSIDLALHLWEQSPFDVLRQVVCPTPGDAQRFRDIVTLAVLATDIADANLTAHRYQQWDRVFGPDVTPDRLDPDGPVSLGDAQMTITLQHLIQAADVGATFQDWTTFTKWNERLIREIQHAFRNHRSPFAPQQEPWYYGEIAFLQGYVVPLTEHLETCCWITLESGGDDDDAPVEATVPPLVRARQNLAHWQEDGPDVMRRIMKDDR